MGPVSGAEVTLFQARFGAPSQRVRLALEEKSIPYKVVDVDLQNKPQGLLEANPIHKKVPTIIYEGKPVAESLVILEYLEEEFPQQAPLMPKDAFEKSKVRFWSDFMYKSFDKFFETIRTKSGSLEQQAAYEEAIKMLKTLETAIAGYSTEGPFFTGETFGFLDVVLAPLENTLDIAEKLGGLAVPGLDEIPRVYKWIDAVKTRASFSSAIPNKEENLSFFKWIVQRRRAAAAAARNAQ